MKSFISLTVFFVCMILATLSNLCAGQEDKATKRLGTPDSIEKSEVTTSNTDKNYHGADVSPIRGHEEQAKDTRELWYYRRHYYGKGGGGKMDVFSGKGSGKGGSYGKMYGGKMSGMSYGKGSGKGGSYGKMYGGKMSGMSYGKGSGKGGWYYGKMGM